MERRIIANIKSLGIDMIKRAGSGHPGIVLGAAPIIATLYKDHLVINPDNPNWLNRDRFIMSAGHGSALLYSTLFMSGYNLSLDDLQNFRGLNSKTPGHPEYGITPGVDCSTGPLGQGFANAVGMAIAEKKLKAMNSIFNYRVYCLCGDGDMMEGISHEAASLAGTLRLNNLIVIYDSNHVSLDGSTDLTFSENVVDRFISYDWNVEFVKNGDDTKSINKAIDRAKKATRPTIIVVNTVIGSGSLLEGSNEVHGKILTDDDIEQLKRKLDISTQPFYVDDDALSVMKKQISDRSLEKYNRWTKEFNNLLSVDTELNKFVSNQEKINLLNYDFKFSNDLNEGTRITNQKVMNYIGNNLMSFIGGSADLSSSTKTYLTDGGVFSSSNYKGKNIYFGVREHAMGAIANGLALSGFRPFVSTFLVFADYLKPAMRMSALMNLPVSYIFSHDSITVGQDGPTHQPIEQLTMLRTIPNFDVYRPCDAKELVGSWNTILNKNNPNALILTRGNVPLLQNSKMHEVEKGAYIIRKEQGRLYSIIIATGSEVNIAVKIADEIYEQYNIDIRVISMPNMDLFLKQSQEYKDSLLPKGYRNIVIEAGNSALWYRFVYNENYLITIDDFGVSATTTDVLKHMNFDYDSIKERVIKLLK
ncbi:MAG: transketolase [Firmicutes bacterium]|nr:transketolase [Bacillota bacterium]